jgi:hypothetical protein
MNPVVACDRRRAGASGDTGMRLPPPTNASHAPVVERLQA